MRVLPQGPSVAEYLCDAAYRFFETTPQDLVHLYKKLAIEFYPSPYRAISLALLCKELGAKRQRSTAEKAIEFATTATTSVVHVSTDTAVKVVKVAQDAVELVYVAATDAAGKLAHDAVEAYEAAADLTARAPAATAGALEQLTRKRSSNSSAGTGGNHRFFLVPATCSAISRAGGASEYSEEPRARRSPRWSTVCCNPMVEYGE